MSFGFWILLNLCNIVYFITGSGSFGRGTAVKAEEENDESVGKIINERQQFYREAPGFGLVC